MGRQTLTSSILLTVSFYHAAPIAAAADLSQPPAEQENSQPGEQRPGAAWPFLRGANYDGHSLETGVADAWPAEGPPLVWARDLGQGYSGFVADEERVYTQFQTLSGQFVACLDARTGETLWKYRYDWPYEMTGLYPGPRSTPTLADDHVFFAEPSGLVGCLTWPVALFVLFQATVDQIRPAGSRASRWTIARGYFVAILFLGGCVAYYLLCRQLCLVTEWAFLCGFAAALPISAARVGLARRGAGVLVRWPLGAVEFTFYYWSSVAVLLWRCQVVGAT